MAQFTLYTRKELGQIAREYAKGHGKLVQWMIEVVNDSGHTRIRLLIDCQKDQWTEQLSVVL